MLAIFFFLIFFLLYFVSEMGSFILFYFLFKFFADLHSLWSLNFVFGQTQIGLHDFVLT